MVARTKPDDGLWIVFTRGHGTVEAERRHARSPEDALMVAVRLMTTLDLLDDGDRLEVTTNSNKNKPPLR
jgi:hypothetical protein